MYIRTTAGEIINTAFMQHMHMSSNKTKCVNDVWEEEYSIYADMHMAPSVLIASGLASKEDATMWLNRIWLMLVRGSQNPNADYTVYDVGTAFLNEKRDG